MPRTRRQRVLRRRGDIARHTHLPRCPCCLRRKLMSHYPTLALPRRQLLASAATASLFGPSLLTQGARAAGADGELLTGSHWGAFHAKVQGGRFVAIRPWEKDPHPTAQLPGVM